MKRRPWTAAEEAMLRDLYPTTITRQIARALGRPQSSVFGRAKKLGLTKSAEFFASDKSGRMSRGAAFRGVRNRFQKGHVPANKGVRGVHYSPVTEFQAGHKPHNYAPIGSLRIHSAGYLQRKVTETGYPPDDWKMVHRLVWEEVHGPIPAGFLVTFKAGRQTTDLEAIKVDALELVSRRELMARNTIHTMPPELAELSRLRGRVTREINKQTKDAA
ncbi:MAG: hypothetical protein RJA99_4264 [Pseudomonadota bacterium]